MFLTGQDLFLPHGSTDSSLSRLHEHTHLDKQKLGRTHLDEGSVRRRDFYRQHTTLTTDIHAPWGIRTRNPSKWAATGISLVKIQECNISQDISASAVHKLWTEQSLFQQQQWLLSSSPHLDRCWSLHPSKWRLSPGRKAIAARSLPTHLSLVSRLKTPGYVLALHHTYLW